MEIVKHSNFYTAVRCQCLGWKQTVPSFGSWFLQLVFSSKQHSSSSIPTFYQVYRFNYIWSNKLEHCLIGRTHLDIFFPKVREENCSLESLTRHPLYVLLYVRPYLSICVYLIYLLIWISSFHFFPWFHSFYVLFTLDLSDLMFLCVLSPFV